MRTIERLIAIAAVAGSTLAHAQPAEDIPDDVDAEPPTPVEPEPASRSEHTAASVAGAPRPGDESGRLDPSEEDSTLRRIGRGALYVPRKVLDAAFFPVRAGVWAVERYHLDARARRLFFNDAGTIGLYPTAKFQSGFGITAGARFVAGDPGKRNQLRLHAGTGGRYREIFSAALRGSRLADDFRFELRGEYERRPEENFYGLGNGDELEMTLPPAAPIDPLSDDAAIETHYRQRLARASVATDARIASDLRVRGAATLTDLELSESTVGPPIGEVYQLDSMIGFTGIRYLYSELELAWDSRRRAHRWESSQLYATGLLAAVYAGRVAIEDRRDFWRYGVDLQHFLRLAEGPRVLALRLHGETVTGPREEVPFIELPALGGETLLRGYPTERFRDRVAAFGSLEYEWDLSRTTFASVFVDAGRVWRSIEDVGFDDLRCGYGFALELHGWSKYPKMESTFWLRASIASSIDGGVFVYFSFDPVFEIDPRAVRR